mmetsp:Transcript_25020/g.49835  ORF Transcript_25020/g.49835 Transcript_25020/m.49835 type:complete len:222 (+) Transcript_25020:973-1638(+)|eukprot:CAMPEP_0182454548 /NCGR_PEP_ID=MMETSP1319-20130603/1130_1 /TAXON_ID=172717 /ORGANISM="Bolidomonas pacifica, Strain RCC208" /LENGTH=221 /DNA_ID=CAMNT_0024652565 /DNA_START=146 /DNA_END=811 /DNA_ORIENTATION=-
MAEKLAPSVFLSEDEASKRSSVTQKSTKHADLHGYLKKKSRHDRWQKRWFEANDHYLTYYKSPQSEKLLACIDLYQTGEIKLASTSDDSPSDDAHTEFSLELGDRFYIIKAETRGDAKRWVQGLNARKTPPSSSGKAASSPPAADGKGRTPSKNEGRLTSFAVTPDAPDKSGMAGAASAVQSQQQAGPGANAAQGGAKSALTKGDGSQKDQMPKGCGCVVS